MAAEIRRRPPEQVMRLKRLGSLHQCRLSFMRVLTRRMARDNWRFSRPLFAFNDKGVGRAVYTAHAGQGENRSYSLIAFGHELSPALRTDRVIATAWDATFALFDGQPDQADLDRLARNVPRQEAGRVSERELSVSRANRSVRLWEHVVSALSQGRQPDRDQLAAVGYLMRTTAVYGSGKFGAADYEMIAGRPEMRTPFQAEMLSVYLTRAFVRDLVNHRARVKGGDRAVSLDAGLARSLGIGNSTGLGLGPYIINHPQLLNNWIMARETAIARVRGVRAVTSGARRAFGRILNRAMPAVARWRSEHPAQMAKLAALRRDLDMLNAHLAGDVLDGSYPWDRLVTWSEGALSAEGQEFLASLILEPYGELVDGLASGMAEAVCNCDGFRIDGSRSVGQTAALIRSRFGWALDMDWRDRRNIARVWYVSQEKREPRLGERFEEPVEAYEQPLAPARDAALAYRDLMTWRADEPVAAFLVAHPEHRHTLRRVQIGADAPYGEIRDNTIAADMVPTDLLRVKLAFFGATHFDPRSDRWLRIAMYQGAPYPEELSAANADFWVYPEAGS